MRRQEKKVVKAAEKAAGLRGWTLAKFIIAVVILSALGVAALWILPMLGHHH